MQSGRQAHRGSGSQRSLKDWIALAGVALWTEHWPLKDPRLDSSQGHVPGLQAPSLLGAMQEAADQ